MPFDRVMRYFQEISQIPRGSGNTDRISEYCEEFAQEHSLFCIREGLGNVIIKKDGTGNPVILQGHLDMVCESEAGSISAMVLEKSQRHQIGLEEPEAALCKKYESQTRKRAAK